MYRFVKYSIWSAIALACLCLGGCDSSSKKPLILPPELSTNEFVLRDKPHIIGEASISFLPVEGTQKEVLSKHQDERNKLLPDTSTYKNFHPGYSALLNGQDIVATYYETPSITTAMGTFYKGYVEVSQEEKVLYTIQTGDSTPASSLRGLWTYDNHWVLEVVHAAEKKGLFQSETDFDLVGDVILDGISLNQQQKYQETFGFQLMNGKPFFFFKRLGHIGISYNGKEIPLEYTQLPHYLCCSGAAFNPKIAENMVSFFAQRNETWYYVEIGIFE